MTTLNGKIAFVTGGSRGIGAAVVRRLAQDGATVVFTYASSAARGDALAAELAALGQRAIPVKADSADPVLLQRVIQDAAREHGRIDILVNNAGILQGGLLQDLSLDDFDRIIAVNVRGYFAAIQAAAAHMPSGGRIVNIGSVVAERIGLAGSSLYGMSKSAIAGLTRGLAHDLGPRGILITNVQPGPTETEIVADEAVRELLRAKMPIGRMGKDSEIADFVAYLVQPGSGFFTGASLTIDGGYLA